MADRQRGIRRHQNQTSEPDCVLNERQIPSFRLHLHGILQVNTLPYTLFIDDLICLHSCKLLCADDLKLIRQMNCPTMRFYYKRI